MDAPHRILLVEDSETQALKLQLILEGEGWEVVWAASAEAALDSLADRLPHLIVVDYYLPGVRGDELCRRIRMNVNTRGIPILMLTVDDANISELHGLESGADDYVSKSADEDILLLRIRALLRKSRPQTSVLESGDPLFHRARLLAIDDSMTYLEYLTEGLFEEGYLVTQATNGSEALDRLEREIFDCVLVDLMLPDIDGIEICRHIVELRRKMDASTAVLMLTASESKEDMTRGLEAGADDFVSKSNDLSVIKARIRALLRRKFFEEENRRIVGELRARELEAVRARAEKEAAEARATLMEQLSQAHEEMERAYNEIKQEAAARRALETELRLKNEELEKQNRRVQEASRLKSEFLANMSHELRTPLNGIIGFAEMLVDEKLGGLNDEQRDFLGDILTSARHLLQLINDVLDLSKVEAGKMEFHAEPVRLSRICKEVCDILRTLAAKKHIVVETLIDHSVDNAAIDPARLKQVLYNFLSNALKFTHEGGRVLLSVSPESEQEFRIDVQDTGIGIDAKDIPRLFREFEQLDRSTSKEYAGTGLGLALTKRIVEWQGGHVRVRSVLGQGSTFSAVLPRCAAGYHFQEAPAAVSPVHHPGAPVILVVEDEPSDQIWLTGMLNGAGYNIEVVETVAEAVAKCDSKKYDAITLDLILPDGSGWDVLRRIRSQGFNREVPVFVVSVIAEKSRSIGLRVDAFFSKSDDPSLLLESLLQAGIRPRSGRTILLLDDDPDALAVMQSTLTDLGYLTVCEQTVVRGLRAAAEHQPDAVILDLLMGIDALEFIHRVRNAARTDPPIIVWTRKDLDSEQIHALRNEAQAVLSKTEDDEGGLLEELRRQLS